MSFKVDFIFYTNFGYPRDKKSNVAYYTVKSAERRGYVNKIITIGLSNTRGLDRRYFVNGVPGGNFTARSFYMIKKLYKTFKARKLIENLLDSYGSRHLSGDVLYTWPRLLNSLYKAKNKGMKTVVYCTTSHPQQYMELVLSEYKKYGIEPRKTFFEIDIKRHIKSIKVADYLFVVSKSSKKTYIEEGIPEEKIITITGTGVDLSKFTPNKIPHEGFNVLFVGDLTPLKGIIYLLEAWSKLNLKNSKLFLVGFIPDNVKKVIENFSRHDDSIILTGPVKDPQRYYKLADVFVTPSLIEGGFGGKVTLEAMASGLPAIVTVGAGGLDIIKEGENGFVIPIKDSDAIANRIQYFYDNPAEIRRMGKKARRTAEGYTWDNFSNNIANGLKVVNEI